MGYAPRMRVRCRALVAMALFLLGLLPAHGQYFGGNKVRHESFDFTVLRTEHFDIYHYDETREAAALAAVLAERWHLRLSRILDHRLSDRQPLIFYAGHPHFRQTNATPGEIGEATGGFTEMFKRRVVMPFAGPVGETDHVLGHELVHAFQFDMVGEGRQRPEAAMRLPLWFIEGMAEYLSLGPEDPHTAMWMRDAVLHDALPPIRRLHRPEYFPYRYGHAFWSYVAGRWGDVVIGELLLDAGRDGNVRQALKSVLGVDDEELSAAWHEALKEEFGPLVEAARPADDYGRPLVRGDPRGRFNVSPALSPDGRMLAFFSERDRFSIELYLLDVDSGAIIRRLTRTVTDPHFDSLQFLGSAGAWAPDGARFAYAGISLGRPVLTVLDTPGGRRVAEHRFADLVEIFNPAWSPDGRHIAFAANTGGFTDLFLYDLADGELRRLTNDIHAVLQPAWSPDGRHIAFVTDRFTSNVERMVFGEYRLAEIDVESGEIRALPALVGGKNINPQWSPDGSAIYFLSDAEGTTNLYRASVRDGGIEALTDLQTGISGISRLSPALSVAARAPDRLAVTIYERGKYHLYLLDGELEGRPVAAAPVPRRPPPGVLPPRERSLPLVGPLLRDPLLDPEEVSVPAAEPYRPRLTLDHVTQPMIGVGVGGEGTSVGGALGIYWSDMLGDHNVMTLFHAEGEVETLHRDIAAIVSYENLAGRWGWGATAGQIPFRSTRLQLSREERDGESLLVSREIREWQINREMGGRLSYPFNRAERVEFFAGMRHISLVGDERIDTFSFDTGRITSESRSLPRFSLSLATAGSALVHDTSVFGSTAPAVGQRYRLELSAAFGDLNYHAPLVDYRRYFLLHPRLTLAGRLLHFGRYGTDAEDPRLGLLFLGRPSLIRGYTAASLRIEECDPPASAPDTCPVIDRLFGSRLAVGNIELRTPLLGPRGFAPSPIRAPLDGVLFYDVGVAWTRAQEPSFLDGPRSPVSSVGMGLRLGILGILVLQWTYVYPRDRPAQDWYWEFTIMPGF
jgi:hypothetical protein